jgi:hypothetical protein
VLVHLNMGIALVVFLLVLPGGLLLLAARPPSSASLRRLSATINVPGAVLDDEDVVAARIRRRRIAGAVGAVLGLWATATWASTTSSWRGLLGRMPRYRGSGVGAGWFSFQSPSFVLRVNLFGILVGFAAGLVSAELTGRRDSDAAHRAALLAPRDSRRYLAPWSSAAVALTAASAVAAPVVAAIIPDSRKTGFDGGSPWWALVLLGVGVGALVTRSFVLSAAPRASDPDDLAAREATRALTIATITIAALAAFTASTAATLTRISTWFGWGWGDGTAVAAQALSLIAVGLVVAAFLTPYWMITLELDADTVAERT